MLGGCLIITPPPSTPSTCGGPLSRPVGGKLRTNQMRAPSGNCKGSYVADNDPFQKLGADVLNLIDAQLGIEAVQLRRASKSIADVPLPPSLALCHEVLRTKRDPVVQGQFGRRRVPPRSVAWDGKHWSKRSHLRSNRWRGEWKTLARTLESAPVNQLMDLHEALWKMRKPPLDPIDLKIDAVEGVLDERLWAACCGKGIHTNGTGQQVVTGMSQYASTQVVKRMFRELGIYNGPTSFFHTKYGWLQFTPFLLAAERGNLALAKWLYKTFDQDVTVLAHSQAGNNAHALHEAELVRKFHTPEQIEESEMLRWLREVGVPAHAPRNEFEVYKKRVAERVNLTRTQATDASCSQSSQSSQSSDDTSCQ